MHNRVIWSVIVVIGFLIGSWKLGGWKKVIKSAINYWDSVVKQKSKIYRFYNKLDNIIINYFLVVIIFLIYFLIIVFVLSLAISLWKAFSYKLDISNWGIENFIYYTSSSIKIGAATIAIITIYLTLKILKQSKEQTFLASENNRFNNYHKYQEMFINHFNELNFIHDYSNYSGCDKRFLILSLFKVYFYPSYKKFRPDLSYSKITFINSLISMLKRYNYYDRRNENDREIDGNEIEKIKIFISSEINWDDVNNLTNPYVIECMDYFRINQNLTQNELKVLQTVLVVVYLLNLFVELFNFVGRDDLEIVKCRLFFRRFLSNYGFEDI